MNSKAFSHLDSRKRDTYAELKEEYDAIQSDINRIISINASEEAKVPILEELQKQINDVKERMHNYIDTL